MKKFKIIIVFLISIMVLIVPGIANATTTHQSSSGKTHGGGRRKFWRKYNNTSIKFW